PVGVIDEVVPVRDLVVDRAALVTIGNAAIHASGRLLDRVRVAEREQELSVVTNTVGRRLVAPVLAFDLEEARDLSHRPSSSLGAGFKIVAIGPSARQGVRSSR